MITERLSHALDNHFKTWIVSPHIDLPVTDVVRGLIDALAELIKTGDIGGDSVHSRFGLTAQEQLVGMRSHRSEIEAYFLGRLAAFEARSPLSRDLRRLINISLRHSMTIFHHIGQPEDDRKYAEQLMAALLKGTRERLVKSPPKTMSTETASAIMNELEEKMPQAVEYYLESCRTLEDT